MPDPILSIIRERREELGLTQRQLARRAGIWQAAISDIEVGRRDPKLSTLRALYTALGLELGALVGGEA